MTKEEKQQLFKEALGNYPTGVTIVTTFTDENIPVGLTVNSFASVSLDPLLILWSIDHRVSSLEAFTKGDKFAVHILAADQVELCKTFATPNVDRFSQCEWSESEFGLPVIEGAFSVLQCELFKAVEAGDHTILIGKVLDIQVENRNPMLYHRRHFGSIPAEFYTDVENN
ncbi:flavin reductase family protein [Siminovitchia sp. FSL H7-0308]|uniref:flavin reductase family protein n=1 Tax=unclassified Siminovitchia TaxID=2837530 RepID=UPI0030D21526